MYSYLTTLAVLGGIIFFQAETSARSSVTTVYVLDCSQNGETSRDVPVCSTANFSCSCSIDEAFEKTSNSSSDVDLFLRAGRHEMSEYVLLNNVTRLRLLGMGQHLSRVHLTSAMAGFRIIDASEVTLSRLTVSVGASTQAVDVTRSSHVTFESVIFYNILQNSRGVNVYNSVNVSFSNCTFEGDSYQVDAENRRMAVAVTFDHFDQRTPYHLTTISTVRLLDCSFRLFLSAAPSFTSVFGASNSSERAAAIKLTFSGKETLQMVVSFQRCSFDDVEMKTSTTINIQFSDGASNNRVEIQNCHFTNCTAKFGAASLINFNTNAVNNTVHFSHTRFRSLTAILQGGAAVVRFIDAHENFVFFMNCTFSHVAAHDLLGIGALLAAYSNVRTSVATLFDSSSSHQIVIGNANVHNNIAADGVIYGKSISLLLTGRRYENIAREQAPMLTDIFLPN